MHQGRPHRAARLQSPAETGGFLVLWTAACGGAVLVSGAAPADLLWPAGAGILASIVGCRLREAGTILMVATVIPAAVAGAAVLPWILAAISTALLVGNVRRDPGGSPLDVLQRHLLRARRRGDGAALVILELEGRDPKQVDELLRTTRATDTFVVNRGHHGLELIGLLDGEDVEEALVEQRLAAALPGEPGAFGWARFPTDGFALEPLLERARASAAEGNLRAGTALLPDRPRGATRPAVLRRIAQSPQLGDDAPSDLPSPQLPENGRIVVTGAAGFLGSHLSERLLDLGHEVVGVDCFTDFYARELKERNLAELSEQPRFTFRRLDLSEDDLSGLLDGVDGVFHLAAQAGVRTSFGDSLATYVRHNVLGTQRLLEEAIGRPLATFTYASSSSVYGNPVTYPTTEDSPRRPVSPYGMTKVATEEVAGVYHRCFEIPTVGLRYFTAYGPRQRPDMAFARFLRLALEGRPIPLNGDGRQVRDFTFVEDIIEGTIAAGLHGRPGTVYNIGGGRPVELRECIALIEALLGRTLEIERRPAQVGDVRMTGCDGALARRELGYEPTTTLADGLAAHLEWLTGASELRPLLAEAR